MSLAATAVPFLAMIAAGAVALATPADGQSGLAVGAARPKPVAPPVHLHHPRYLPGLIPPPRPTIRCEQDRLLTDSSPCGAATVAPLAVAPPPLKHCAQDRLLTDTTPCRC